MKTDVTYDELVERYGENGAFDVLLTLERSAHVESNPSTIDEEARLKSALEMKNGKCSFDSG